MTAKFTIKTLDKQLAARMKAIAKERDLLDALIGDARQLRDDIIEAYDDLDRARDALSRLV